jgi:Icc protein
LESLLTLPVVNKSRINILQVTDTHLFANVHETLLGVNTHHSYHAVLDAIIAEHPFVDLVVATGDLVQDSSPVAYQHFATGITRLPAPCVWLPGNHDAQSVMRLALIQAGITPAKQVLLSDSWQVILLDSQASGVPHGELSDNQLKWMALTHNATL